MTWRSLASTVICGPIVTAPTRYRCEMKYRSTCTCFITSVNDPW